MLGGEEDDIEELVAECINQPEPVVRAQGLQHEPQRLFQRQETVSGPDRPDHQMVSTTADSTQLQRLLEQNSKLFEIITKQQEQQGEGSGEKSKRKLWDDISYNPTAPLLLLE